jgi:hypothetical protein
MNDELKTPATIHEDIAAIRDLAVICANYQAVPDAVSQALQAAARVVDDLVHRVEMLEDRKPCECQGDPEAFASLNIGQGLQVVNTEDPAPAEGTTPAKTPAEGTTTGEGA